MGASVSWDRSFTKEPIPAEGETYLLNERLLRVLNNHMGNPPVVQVYTTEGISVRWARERSFFSREMVGGRLVTGNPGDSQFAIKFFRQSGQYANPNDQSEFRIRHFSLNRGLSSLQIFCNVKPLTSDLVEPACADLTQVPEITEHPIRPDQVELNRDVRASAVPAELSVKAKVLLAALGELPNNQPNQRFIALHRAEIDSLSRQIEATQR